MKLTDDEWKKALEQHLKPEMVEAGIQGLLDAALSTLPEEMKEAALTPGNYLRHTLRACATMVLTAGMSQTRGILDHLSDNYQEKPEVFANQMKLLLEQFQKRASSKCAESPPPKAEDPDLPEGN